MCQLDNSSMHLTAVQVNYTKVIISLAFRHTQFVHFVIESQCEFSDHVPTEYGVSSIQ